MASFIVGFFVGMAVGVAAGISFNNQVKADLVVAQNELEKVKEELAAKSTPVKSTRGRKPKV
jgi:uncharacterized membrane-anchored protein YhcB (DUF1043 family)